VSYEDDVCDDSLGAVPGAFLAAMTAQSALAAAGVLSNPITVSSPKAFARVQVTRIIPMLKASLADFTAALEALKEDADA